MGGDVWRLCTIHAKQLPNNKGLREASNAGDVQPLEYLPVTAENSLRLPRTDVPAKGSVHGACRRQHGTHVAMVASMRNPKLVVVGGGLAGLSTGCYAQANGFNVTIAEHNLALGGVCTAWRRGDYLVDGCIHWLTGGPFLRLYEEVGIVPSVPLRQLEEFAVYRHARDGWAVHFQRDLQATEDALRALSPEDGDELTRLFDAANRLGLMRFDVEQAPEVKSLGERLRDVWHLRHDAVALAHFRAPLGDWKQRHLKSPQLRRIFGRLLPDEAPTIFLAFVLGYLGHGHLSRPLGGTARFRDALAERYRSLGGEALVNTTVEEILVSEGRAKGVRLTDGSLLEADVVVSTASAPETVFRLLGGRYGADDWRRRMDTWRMFQPIVLASFGVARPLAHEPAMLFVDNIDTLTVGGHPNEHLYLRIYNDDPAFAPPGHTVVQALVETDYHWWATRGSDYQHEKDVAADRVLSAIDQHLPGVKAQVRMVDVATPLTFWRSARVWRGAFEGWLPTSKAFTHVSKTLPGLEGFYMAGQWVEPGGGVPMAIMSGRHVVEIICADSGRPFVSPLETTQASPSSSNRTGATEPTQH